MSFPPRCLDASYRRDGTYDLLANSPLASKVSPTKVIYRKSNVKKTMFQKGMRNFVIGHSIDDVQD